MYSMAFVIGQFRNNEEPIIGQLVFYTAWHVLTASCLVCLKLSNVKSGIHNLLDVCI